MGTIIPRKRRDGTVGYQAQIVIKRAGASHRETKTFDRRPAAAAWIEKRERELSLPGALERARSPSPKLSDAIDRYLAETARGVGKTKSQVLRALKEFPIADLACDRVDSPAIVAFAQEKLATGVKPQTVANYLAHLSSIFTLARPAWGYPLDRHEMDAALVVAGKMGLTGKSAPRGRRPTLDELDALMTHFGEVLRRRPSSVPMQKIIAFALFSTRRQEEITRIRWADLEAEGARVLVRDMKNPGEKIGNDVWCDLPAPALAVIRAMPRREAEIFPYSADAISAAFTRACAFLGIEDLHFHDLRHEGVSRLFEMGLTIPHVAAVSGHRSWTSLKRYTHLRASGDRYARWKWLGAVSAPEPSGGTGAGA